jgi:PHP family Zn ribbon phosphoesterase
MQKVPHAFRKGAEAMFGFICSKCLRLWGAERVSHRTTCPHCGGALSAR